MAKFENTNPAIKPSQDAEIKSALQQAAEMVQALMRDGGYGGYTVTITAETITIVEPKQGIDPQPPKQSI